MPVATPAANSDELDALQSGLTETQSALDAAHAALTAREARISELEAQVAELEQEPGAQPAKLVTATDGAPASNPKMLTKEDVELFNLIRS
jgi:uncharacterized protein YPO0396